MIRFESHKDQHFIEVVYDGDIYVQDIVDFLDSITNNHTAYSHLKIITFADQASFKFGHSELEPIVEAAKRLYTKYGTIREAFVIDSPQSVVIATTYKLLINSNTDNYRMEIFSTPEAAFRWQGIDFLDLGKEAIQSQV